MSKENGVVSWFDEENGFGYIAHENGGPDVSVHYSAIISDGVKTLGAGQKVEYSVVQGQRGPEAVDLILL